MRGRGGKGGGGAQSRASSVHVASQESARVTPRTNIKEEGQGGGRGGGERGRGGGVIRGGGRWQEVTGLQ